jgi:alpha-beta hydrolase superfamily lysophospholipase
MPNQRTYTTKARGVFTYCITSVCLLIFGIATSVVSGCSIGNRAVEAPEDQLTPAGWQNNKTLLQNRSFEQYATAVNHELYRHRIPFDNERAEQEIDMASPVELPPGANCNAKSKGVAILVHGLADTAFSMKDIGRVLADACYTSRVILLPGHGTRGGDLLITRLSDWQQTIQYLIDQAAMETDNIVLAGFSLGAVLTLEAAMRRPDDIAGVIAISPAYYLSSERLTKWAPLAAPFVRWVDRGVADDPMRYEAMPTRGVAETWKAIKQMHQLVKRLGQVQFPWMLAQSMDDAVVVPDKNEAFWKAYAVNPASRLIRFVSDQEYAEEERAITLAGSDATERVIALTHLAIHQSPDNPHYGRNGRYRNCGSGMPRATTMVSLCEESDSVWYGLWSTEPEPGRAMAYSTFNPSFDQFASELKRFASQL